MFAARNTSITSHRHDRDRVQMLIACGGVGQTLRSQNTRKKGPRKVCLLLHSSIRSQASYSHRR